MAQLLQTIYNISGKIAKKEAKLSWFLPVYIKTEKPVTDPLQRAEYAAFKQKLADAKGLASGT